MLDNDIRVLVVLEWLLRVCLGALVVMRQRTPAVALTWLVVIGFLPVFGGICYLFLGEIRLGRFRVRRYEDVSAPAAPPQQLEDPGRVYHIRQDPDYASVGNLAEAVGGGAVLGGNRCEVIAEAEAFIDHLIADIDAAENHIHLMFYIVNIDDGTRRVIESLLAAEARGVQVRILVDDVGSRRFLRHRLCTLLREGGAEVVGALPAHLARLLVARVDLRNHRKVAIIDGRVAYTGSHNLTLPLYPKKRKFGPWVDASLRIQGPTVHALQEVFLHDWCAEADRPPSDGLYPPWRVWEHASALQVLPSGPLVPGAFADVLLQALRIARRQVMLTSPYFVPNDDLIAAMRAAALRGVAVDLVVPQRSDHPIAQAAGRSHYGALLDAGIRIHEFGDGILHAKTLTVDHQVAMIGSSNLDTRSFVLNFELAILVQDADLVDRLHYLQQGYRERSLALDHRRWRKRKLHQRFVDQVAKLATPLL